MCNLLCPYPPLPLAKSLNARTRTWHANRKECQWLIDADDPAEAAEAAS